MRTTRPFTGSPTLWRLNQSSQWSGSSCLIPRESFWLGASMLRITAWTSSPFFSTSEGCLTRLVQEMSETCTRPSIPSSTSMKAPKSVMLRTFPVMTVPGA